MQRSRKEDTCQQPVQPAYSSRQPGRRFEETERRVKFLSNDFFLGGLSLNNDCHILYSNHISPWCKIIWIVSIWKPLTMAITSGPSYQMVLESAFMKSSWSIFYEIFLKYIFAKFLQHNLRKKVFDIGNHIFFPNKIFHQWKVGRQSFAILRMLIVIFL